MFLGIDFQWDFGGFLVPKWSQVGTKMEPKIDIALKAKNPKIIQPARSDWPSGDGSWVPKSMKN